MNDAINMSKTKKRDIPVFDLPIIETHCHLDFLKETSIDEAIFEAREHNIESIITIATQPDNLDTVLSIADSHTMVFGTQGIHPHDAKDFTQSVEQQIRKNLNSEKMIAVGEIGLDYYYGHSDDKSQRYAFESQLQIAVEADLPIVVHTREADEDTKAILGNFSKQLAKKGVIHSFTSSLELAEYCLAQGFSLGFNGIMTFNKAENVREIVAATPLDRILLETDAPYLTPVPYRGKENSPKYLPFIAERVAEVKGCELEEVLKACFKNSKDLFQLPN